jgi:hypothetical protein
VYACAASVLVGQDGNQVGNACRHFVRRRGQAGPRGRRQSAAGCHLAGMALRATKGDENPRGSSGFDDARKGWPRGQPRTRGVRPTFGGFRPCPTRTPAASTSMSHVGGCTRFRDMVRDGEHRLLLAPRPRKNRRYRGLTFRTEMARSAKRTYSRNRDRATRLRCSLCWAAIAGR